MYWGVYTRKYNMQCEGMTVVCDYHSASFDLGPYSARGGGHWQTPPGFCDFQLGSGICGGWNLPAPWQTQPLELACRVKLMSVCEQFIQLCMYSWTTSLQTVKPSVCPSHNALLPGRWRVTFASYLLGSLLRTCWSDYCFDSWLVGSVVSVRVPTSGKSWIFSWKFQDLEIPGKSRWSWKNILESDAFFYWFKWKTSSYSVTRPVCVHCCLLKYSVECWWILPPSVLHSLSILCVNAVFSL